MDPKQLRQWEAEEVHRSAVDAAHYTDLVIHDLERYSSPQPDTPYQLEYSAYLLGDLSGRTVVDYGCGAGENSVLLAKRNAHVIGIDISPDLLELAKHRMELHGIHNNYDFRVGSCLDTGLPDHSVDGVFAIAILHHLVVDLDGAAREIRRILKPRGFLILQEPIRDNSLARVARRLVPARAEDISPQERCLTTPELLHFVSGMEIAAIRKFRLPHLVFLSGDWAYKLDGALLRALPFLAHFATNCVIKAVAPAR